MFNDVYFKYFENLKGKTFQENEDELKRRFYKISRTLDVEGEPWFLECLLSMAMWFPRRDVMECIFDKYEQRNNHSK